MEMVWRRWGGKYCIDMLTEHTRCPPRWQATWKGIMEVGVLYSGGPGCLARLCARLRLGKVLLLYTCCDGHDKPGYVFHRLLI